MKPFPATLAGRTLIIEPVAQRRKTLRFQMTGAETLRVYHPKYCTRHEILATLMAHPRMIQRVTETWREPTPAPDLTPQEKRNWTAEAIAKVQRVMDRCCQETGLRPSYVKLKELRSIWGSCTGKNGINLNIRLCYCPEEVLRYVVIHELCHLKERNHSPAFWTLVAQYDPEYKAHRNYLKQHQADILNRPLGMP